MFIVSAEWVKTKGREVRVNITCMGEVWFHVDIPQIHLELQTWVVSVFYDAPLLEAAESRGVVATEMRGSAQQTAYTAAEVVCLEPCT